MTSNNPEGTMTRIKKWLNEPIANGACFIIIILCIPTGQIIAAIITRYLK